MHPPPDLDPWLYDIPNLGFYQPPRADEGVEWFTRSPDLLQAPFPALLPSIQPVTKKPIGLERVAAEVLRGHIFPRRRSSNEEFAFFGAQQAPGDRAALISHNQRSEHVYCDICSKVLETYSELKRHDAISHDEDGRSSGYEDYSKHYNFAHQAVNCCKCSEDTCCHHCQNYRDACRL